MKINNLIARLSSTLLIAGLLFLTGCASAPPSSTGISQATNKSGLNEKYRSEYLRALNALEEKNYKPASVTLNKVMADNPGFVEGWANLALAQLHAGDIQAAKQSVNNALQLDQQAGLYNLAGLVAAEDGAYKTAEQHYARAIQINPNLANAHYNLALLNDIYYQNIAKAIQHYERYLALINDADPDTEAWVQELKRNLK